MSFTKILGWSVAAIGGWIALLWAVTGRTGYESAEYRVLRSEPPFEIREYPDLMLATTRMRFQSQGDDGSFMRLFRYISGGNQSSQKIAMTTPVFMEPDAGERPGRMGFVLPRQVTEAGVPAPAAEDVEVTARAGGRFAVYRFAGRMTPAVCAEAEKKLRNWVAREGLEGEPVTELAGYDPPWTPSPLRRNEVLLRLRGQAVEAP